MNLEDQKLTGVGELVIDDSLNAPLLELKIKRNSTTIVPSTNDLIVYVDNQSSTNSSTNRREYIFSLLNALQYSNNISDEFKISLVIKDSDMVMKTMVTRVDGSIEIYEDYTNLAVSLFEGINYIYTNYSNADIEVVYPKNNDMNKYYLNSAIYVNHKYKNKSDFSLDDIYFKDAFTKTEDKLNLEVDNASIGCMTSKNNKFSLDENGNLVVNSVTCNTGGINTLDAYTVGSIYTTSTNTNPSTLIGGSWELVDKEFTPALLGTILTNNTTNTTSNNIYAARAGHSIEITGTFVNKVKIIDTALDLGQFNLGKLGITSLPYYAYITSYTDGGNSGAYLQITTAGVLRVVDCYPNVPVPAGSSNIITVTLIFTQSSMLDSECNKFYWKRIA